MATDNEEDDDDAFEYTQSAKRPSPYSFSLAALFAVTFIIALFLGLLRYSLTSGPNLIAVQMGVGVVCTLWMGGLHWLSSAEKGSRLQMLGLLILVALAIGDLVGVAVLIITLLWH
jgi:hypothetical protein